MCVEQSQGGLAPMFSGGGVRALPAFAQCIPVYRLQKTEREARKEDVHALLVTVRVCLLVLPEKLEWRVDEST